jgi:hypothetical protein
MLANPIGLIILGLIALGAAIVVIVKHFDSVKKAMGKVDDVFRMIWGGIVKWFSAGVVAPILSAIKVMVDGFLRGILFMLDAAGHLPGKLGAPFRGAAAQIRNFKENFDASMAGAIATARGAGSGIGSGIARSLPAFRNVIANAHGMATALNGIPKNVTIRIITKYSVLGDPTAIATGKKIGFQHGTPFAPPGWAMVGERGPEWLRFAGGERVLPYGTRPPRAAPAASAPELLQPIVLQVDGKVLWQSLQRVKRQNGGLSLGLS